MNRKYLEGKIRAVIKLKPNVFLRLIDKDTVKLYDSIEDTTVYKEASKDGFNHHYNIIQFLEYRYETDKYKDYILREVEEVDYIENLDPLKQKEKLIITRVINFSEFMSKYKFTKLQDNRLYVINPYKYISIDGVINKIEKGSTDLKNQTQLDYIMLEIINDKVGHEKQELIDSEIFKLTITNMEK